MNDAVKAKLDLEYLTEDDKMRLFKVIRFFYIKHEDLIKYSAMEEYSLAKSLVI